MPIALALALVATIGGAVASYSYDDDALLGTRLAYGATTGFLTLGFAGFIAATLAGPLSGPCRRPSRRCRCSPLRGATSARASALTPGPPSPGSRTASAASLSTTGPLVFWAAIVALLWVAFDRVIVENDGTLATGFVNNLGDLPFHIGIVSGFAYGQNYPPENPIFAGSGFSYPYIADVVTAQFVQLGATMREAFFVQNLILGVALVGLLQRFAGVLTRDRLASFIAPLIVLFSGGLGWLLLIDQARVGEQGIVSLIGNLPQDYTLIGEAARFGNAITTLLVTQRSLALGLPMALIVFVVLWHFVHDRPVGRPETRGSAAWGFVSYRPAAAAVLTACCRWSTSTRSGSCSGRRSSSAFAFRAGARGAGPWAVYVVVTLLLALPAIWWSSSGSVSNTGTFFGFELGWDHGIEPDLVLDRQHGTVHPDRHRDRGVAVARARSAGWTCCCSARCSSSGSSFPTCSSSRPGSGTTSRS